MEKWKIFIIFQQSDSGESWQLQTEGNNSSWDMLHKWAATEKGEGSYSFL